MDWYKYLLAAFFIVLLIAIGVYVDCRIFQDGPTACREMVFTKIGDRLTDWIPHFR